MPLVDDAPLGESAIGGVGRVGRDARAAPAAVVTAPDTDLLGQCVGERGGVRTEGVCSELEHGIWFCAQLPQGRGNACR